MLVVGRGNHEKEANRHIVEGLKIRDIAFGNTQRYDEIGDRGGGARGGSQCLFRSPCSSVLAPENFRDQILLILDLRRGRRFSASAMRASLFSGIIEE